MPVGRYCCASKIIKFSVIAPLGTVATIATIAILSSPATARDGGGNRPSLKSWDTDNLLYSGYSARTFGVPFHDYSGYVLREAAKPYIAYRGGGYNEIELFG